MFSAPVAIENPFMALLYCLRTSVEGGAGGRGEGQEGEGRGDKGGERP